jgi:hypothetical protein
VLVETTETVTGCRRCEVLATPHGWRHLVRDVPSAGRAVLLVCPTCGGRWKSTAARWSTTRPDSTVPPRSGWTSTCGGTPGRGGAPSTPPASWISPRAARRGCSRWSRTDGEGVRGLARRPGASLARRHRGRGFGSVPRVCHRPAHRAARCDPGAGRVPRRQARQPGPGRGPPPRSAKQLGHRGHRDDPLYRVRRLLRRGAENLTHENRTKLEAALQAGDPDWEVTIAWHYAQRLRAIYHADTSPEGRRQAEALLDSLPTCPIPEIARLGRTLRSWQTELLAYFDTDGASNGPTEAINLLVEKARRIGHGYRNLDNYRLRLLLLCA